MKTHVVKMVPRGIIYEFLTSLKRVIIFKYYTIIIPYVIANNMF